MKLRESTICMNWTCSHCTQIPKKIRPKGNRQKYSHWFYLSLISPQAVQWVRRNLQQLAALWIQSPSGWDTVLTTCLQPAFRKHLRLILLCTGAQPTEKEGMWGNTFPTKRMFAAKHYSTAPFSLRNIANISYCQEILSWVSSLFSKGKGF